MLSILELVERKLKEICMFCLKDWKKNRFYFFVCKITKPPSHLLNLVCENGCGLHRKI